MRQDSLPKTSVSTTTHQIGFWLSEPVILAVRLSFSWSAAREYVAFEGTLGHSDRFIDSSPWDATYYRDIARDGYSFHPGQQSTVHFCPCTLYWA